MRLNRVSKIDGARHLCNGDYNINVNITTTTTTKGTNTAVLLYKARESAQYGFNSDPPLQLRTKRRVTYIRAQTLNVCSSFTNNSSSIL